MKAPNQTGEQRRDETLPRVRDRRPLHVWRAQLAMLKAMRKRPDRCGTSDDMTPRGEQYAGNAPWLGAAVRQLAEHGLIVRIGSIRSKRPSRKANEVKHWRLRNDFGADAKIHSLQSLLHAVTTGDQLPLPFDNSTNHQSETPSVGAPGVSSIQTPTPVKKVGIQNG